MKKSGMLGIFTALLGGALFSHKECGLNQDPQMGRTGKSKGGGKRRGFIDGMARRAVGTTMLAANMKVDHRGKYFAQFPVTPGMNDRNWHESNRAGFRGPRGTGHARKKCWR